MTPHVHASAVDALAVAAIMLLVLAALRMIALRFPDHPAGRVAAYLN